MSAGLLLVQPHDTLLTRLGIYLFNWVTWILPALYDSIAPDVGSNYRLGLTGILSAAIAVMGVVLLFGLDFFALATLPLLGCVLVAYLFFGALYHLYERSWNK